MPLIVLALLGIVGLMLLSWLRASRETRRDDAAQKLPSEAKQPKS